MHRVLTAPSQVPFPCRALRSWAALGLALAVLAALAAPANAQEKPPPFDEATLAAWKKAGAEVGWMGKHEVGFLRFQTSSAGLTGAAPAFHFARWQEGLLASLPDPGLLFGLDLRFTRVTGAGLKELAGLKSLQALYLWGTKVTDAGVEALRKALPHYRISR